MLPGKMPAQSLRREVQLATGRPIPILKEHDVDNEPSSHPAPDDMHWGISYLREDLQDLRQEMRALHGRIDQISESLTRRIDSRFALLLTAMIALDGLVVGAIIAFLKLYLPS